MKTRRSDSAPSSETEERADGASDMPREDPPAADKPPSDAPPAASVADEAVRTIEEWAVAFEHVDVPPAPRSTIDVSKQRAWVFKCLMQHHKFPRGLKMTRDEYQAATDAVLKIGMSSDPRSVEERTEDEKREAARRKARAAASNAET